MAKNNVRSFRFSDRVAEILVQQEGDSLNDKFERLVLRCHDEVPKVERRLSDLDAEIRRAQQELQRIRGLYQSLLNAYSHLQDVEDQYKRISSRLGDIWQELDALEVSKPTSREKAVTNKKTAAAQLREPVRK